MGQPLPKVRFYVCCQRFDFPDHLHLPFITWWLRKVLTSPGTEYLFFIYTMFSGKALGRTAILEWLPGKG
jgi:hypothetical protein